MKRSARLPIEVRAAFVGARLALGLIAIAALGAFALLVTGGRTTSKAAEPAKAATPPSIRKMNGKQLKADLGIPVRTFLSERLGVPKGFCRTYVREGVWMIILCTPRSEETGATDASLPEG